MDVQLTEEQTILQDSVIKFLQAEISLEKVRELADDPKGLSDELWQKISEQGWPALMIPEEYGGIGLGVTELALVCEEMGRMVTPGGFLSSVLAGYAITLGGNDALKSQWLERIASGEVRGTLALLEEDGQLAPASVLCKAEQSGDGFVLNGKKSLVADLEGANVVVVAARLGDSVELFVVDKTAEGVEVKANKLTDLTSRSAQLYLNGVTVSADAKLDGGWDTLDKVLLVANICIAAECLGGAEYIHKLTVAYAKERQQFGKFIGSFQAVKHPLVDLFALIESARSAYHYATWAADSDDPSARTAMAVARNTCVEAYRRTTLDGLQAHGGIAFTWEYDLHLFLKRAKHNQYTYGEPRDFDELICKEALGI